MIDGKSILSVITENTNSPHEFIYYTALTGNIVGVRDTLYKYHEGTNGVHVNLVGNFGPANTLVPELTNLKLDNEAHNLIKKYPQRAKELKEMMITKQNLLENNRRGWQ